MDVSVVAAVGSFFMSEKVLKPKATLLSILGCITIYDLTTKTHDTASLRAYRGPALLAFTLIMTAYSLRTWRRNGVACDELLFLPGTPHGEEHGISSPAPSVRGGAGGGGKESRSDEGDIAGGINNWEHQTRQSNTSSNQPPNNTNPASAEEGPVVQMTALPKGPLTRNRSMSADDSSLSSIREFANSWDENECDTPIETTEDDNELVMLSRSEAGANRSRSFRHSQSSSGVADRSMHAIHSNGNVTSTSTNAAASGGTHGDSDPVDRFRESHPQITRIGSFFFFRSSSTSTQSAAYAPSGPSVVGAALDLSMPILFNFHLFIEAFNHYDAHGGSETPAKILPLIFLTVLMFRTTVPPGRRGRFWGTMKYTFMAPFHASLFRDSFLGDVLTSLVRPFQDVAFALAYYVTVVYGTVTGKYGLSDSGRILESSAILHNVILPSCSLLPLWWKFLQTLRESYDTGERWPHLGNAFKYLTASIVILYGMTHPDERQSAWWICSFIATLLYQIWWDTMMDWELFVISPFPPRDRPQHSLETENHWCTRISSVRPNSYILLALQRNIFQPIRDLVWFALSYVPSWKQIQLRPRRLYKKDAFYWRIFCYNCVFRAVWMLCYIPSYHMDGHSFKSDTHSYLGVLMPVAEILRRTFWGFLLLEVKTIQMTDSDPTTYGVVGGGGGSGVVGVGSGIGVGADHHHHHHQVDEEQDEMNPLFSDSMGEDSQSSKHGTARKNLPSWLGNPQQLQHDATTAVASTIPRRCGSLELSDEVRHKLFITELSLWAVAFIGCGLWATT